MTIVTFRFNTMLNKLRRWMFPQTFKLVPDDLSDAITATGPLKMFLCGIKCKSVNTKATSVAVVCLDFFNTLPINYQHVVSYHSSKQFYTLPLNFFHYFFILHWNSLTKVENVNCKHMLTKSFGGCQRQQRIVSIFAEIVIRRLSNT